MATHIVSIDNDDVDDHDEKCAGAILSDVDTKTQIDSKSKVNFGFFFVRIRVNLQ